MMAIQFLPGLLNLLFIPVLIVIHSLRHRPVKKEVSSLFIWESVIKEKKSAVYFETLLKNVSLLLQILVILLLAFALSAPVGFVDREGEKKHIIILDTSASMKTRTGDGTRFQKAVKAVQALVNTMAFTDQAMIIDAGVKPDIISGFSNDKTAMLKRVKNTSPSDVRSDLKQAVYLALSFFPGSGRGRIFLVTDRAGLDPDFLPARIPELEPVIISGGDNNQAILNFTFRRRPGTKKKYDLLAAVKNFSASSVVCPLIIRNGSRIIYEKNIGLDAGMGKTVTYSFEGTVNNYMTARIRVNDDLEVDNTAWAALKPEKKINIYLVSKGSYFLERLLAVMDNVNITRSEQIPEGAWDAIIRYNHIIILDNMSPPPGSKGNYLIFNAEFPGLPMRLGETSHKLAITDWHQQSTITANVDFSGLYVQNARRMALSDPMIPLLESADTPLICQYYDDRIRAVIFGFDLNDSDLPLRVAFPVLMKNIFTWLHPVSNGFKGTYIPAGNPVDIHVQADASTVAVRRPSGEWEKTVKNKGVFSFKNTKEVGLYKIRSSHSRFHVAVNLFDEHESNISMGPAKGYERAIESPDQESSTATHTIPLWPAVFFTAVLLGVVEIVISIKGRTS